MNKKKKCTICNKIKHKEEFLQKESKCKDCAKKNRQLNRKEKKLELKILSVIYKGSECVDCGISFPNYPPIVFDFHHETPSEKNMGINVLIKIKSSLDDLKEELDKCVLLCSNCHRIRHKPDSKLYETYVKKYT